jgi:hypothetical protein
VSSDDESRFLRRRSETVVNDSYGNSDDIERTSFECAKGFLPQQGMRAVH